MPKKNNVDIKNQIKILEFWEKVEYFSAYDVDNYVPDKTPKCVLTIEQLSKNEKILPWSSSKILQQYLHEKKQKIECDYEYSYIIYFGVFDMNRLTGLCDSIFGNNDSDIESVDRKQKLDLKGNTCIATLPIDEKGKASFNEFSVSTMPWAMSQLANTKYSLNERLNNITNEDYQRCLHILKDRIKEIKNRYTVDSEGGADDLMPMSSDFLMLLFSTILNWAGFNNNKAKIFIKINKNKKKYENSINKANEEKIAQEENITSDEQKVGILNSFYISDIREVIDNYKRNNLHSTLSSYLCGENENKRINLYGSNGRQEILEKTKPSYMNHARWPSEDNHYMSLMQQYAINCAFEKLEANGIYSVNGPPGTGKTTMLKDMVAEILVKRANVLSKLESASKAFKGEKHDIIWKDKGNTKHEVPMLIDELIGFEMLVISSNNAAVENISKELPLSSSLGEAYREIKYLNSVAANVQAHDSFGKFTEIQDDSAPWGLISTALGNKANRNKFCCGFFGANKTGKENLEDGKYGRIYEGVNNYKKNGITFEVARKQFIEANDKVTQYIIQLEKSPRQEDKKDYYIHPDEFDDINRTECQIRSFWMSKTLNELRSKLFIAALELHEAWLCEVYQDRNINFPSQCLFAISNLLEGKKLEHEKDSQVLWQLLFMIVPVISSTAASVSRQFNGIDKEGLGWLFVDESGQAAPHIAIGALWKTKRAIIVGDPLQVEPVYTIPPQIVKCLGKHYLQDNAKSWSPLQQSVQTLADRANSKGAYIEQNNGDLIWIGSPLRVHRRCSSPMFNISNIIAYNNKMIQGKIESTFTMRDSETNYGNWSRAQKSDICGTGHDKLSDENDYQNDPIYSLSGGEIVFEEFRHLYVNHHSLWIDVEGEAVDDQFVNEQSIVSLRLLIQIYEHERTLNNLNVFIISPFKIIKERLKQFIGSSDNWNKYLPDKEELPNENDLKEWCKQNIGTVHTFQGKENNTVLFVLGVDAKGVTSAKWASKNPNLLNVAASRAKDRLYVIGPRFIWKDMQYFDIAEANLFTKYRYSVEGNGDLRIEHIFDSGRITRLEFHNNRIDKTPELFDLVEQYLNSVQKLENEIAEKNINILLSYDKVKLRLILRNISFYEDTIFLNIYGMIINANQMRSYNGLILKLEKYISSKLAGFNKNFKDYFKIEVNLILDFNVYYHTDIVNKIVKSVSILDHDCIVGQLELQKICKYYFKLEELNLRISLDPKNYDDNITLTLTAVEFYEGKDGDVHHYACFEIFVNNFRIEIEGGSKQKRLLEKYVDSDLMIGYSDEELCIPFSKFTYY